MKKSVPLQKLNRAFTLVELLAVMTIIGILAALVLGTFKLVQDKSARSRADSEIKAMETALESYKVDNGDYPRNGDTDSLDARTKLNPSDYANVSKILYRALSGDTNLDRIVNTLDSATDIYGSAVANPPVPAVAPKVYFEFKQTNLSPTGGTGTITALVDPWGNNYGYSTAYQANAANAGRAAGYNPTFDLWSTGGSTSEAAKWLKNW